MVDYNQETQPFFNVNIKKMFYYPPTTFDTGTIHVGALYIALLLLVVRSVSDEENK